MTGQPANPDDGRLDNLVKGSADVTTGGPDTAVFPERHERLSTSDQQQIAAQARELTHAIARELAAEAPAGWQQLEAVFAWTVAAQSWRIYSSNDGHVLRIEPSEKVIALVHEQRAVTARTPGGPWWRMLIRLTNTGALETDYDHGDEPFPNEDLFAPDAYLADLQVHPRLRVPLWLAAYVGHKDRQKRSPRAAAEQARRHRDTGPQPRLSTEDLPPLPQLWGRWATVAALYAAGGSPEGPRILPSLAWFEGPTRSGSTLYLLAHNRAVISGGVWNDTQLEAAYNQDAPMPELYAGAPEWVTDAVLNPRAAAGTLSFCYWWEDGYWYRGQSPSGPGIAAAVPGVWTTETTLAVIIRILTGGGGKVYDHVEKTAAELISAAETGTVTRAMLAALLDADIFDLDAAYNQLTLAGLTRADIESRRIPIIE